MLEGADACRGGVDDGGSVRRTGAEASEAMGPLSGEERRRSIFCEWDATLMTTIGSRRCAIPCLGRYVDDDGGITSHNLRGMVPDVRHRYYGRARWV